MNASVKKILFDKKNTAPLLLNNGNGTVISFEQIFAVKRKKKIYCILRPLAPVNGVSSQTAFVFSVDDNGVFRAVDDAELTGSIFTEYYKTFG